MNAGKTALLQKITSGYSQSFSQRFMTSIFTDKAIIPTTTDLKKAIGNSFVIWQTLADFTKQLYPDARGL